MPVKSSMSTASCQLPASFSTYASSSYGWHSFRLQTLSISVLFYLIGRKIARQNRSIQLKKCLFSGKFHDFLYYPKPGLLQSQAGRRERGMEFPGIEKRNGTLENCKAAVRASTPEEKPSGFYHTAVICACSSDAWKADFFLAAGDFFSHIAEVV